MKKDIIIVFSLVFIFLIIPIAYGIVTHGSNYFVITDNVNYQMRGVISGGGEMGLSGGSFNAQIIVGQPMIGQVSNSNYTLYLGFFFGGVSQAIDMTTIDLAGTLTYANGTPVSNADVRGIVSYGSESYEDTTTTDANGYFELSIVVPQYFLNYEFLLQIFVVGEVDALFECIYCPADGTCTATGCP